MRHLSETWDINEQEFFALTSLPEKIRFLLRYAILAPSTHNSQPWLFHVTDQSCIVSYNPKLALPQADPLGRDLFISLGCAIENLCIAARYFNMFERIEYASGSDTTVAEIFFSPGTSAPNLQEEQLFRAIRTRVNARGLFTSEPLSEEVLAHAPRSPHATTHYVVDSKKILQLANLTKRGIRLAYTSTDFRKEMSAWMHSSFSSAREGLLGYSLKMPALLSLVIPTLVRYFDISPLLAMLNYKSFTSAPTVCVITASDNTRLSWLQTGHLAERLMLWFNAHGVNTSIFMASIEIGNFAQHVQEIIDTKETPQFLFCIGYMDEKQVHSPRHPLSDKIL